MLHVPLQLSLLPLGLLLCRLVCSGKKSPLEEGDPRSSRLKQGPRASPEQGPPPVSSLVHYDDKGTGCSPVERLALFAAGAGEVQRLQTR